MTGQSNRGPLARTSNVELDGSMGPWLWGLKAAVRTLLGLWRLGTGQGGFPDHHQGALSACITRQERAAGFTVCTASGAAQRTSLFLLPLFTVTSAEKRGLHRGGASGDFQFEGHTCRCARAPAGHTCAAGPRPLPGPQILSSEHVCVCVGGPWHPGTLTPMPVCSAAPRLK